MYQHLVKLFQCMTPSLIVLEGKKKQLQKEKDGDKAHVKNSKTRLHGTIMTNSLAK